MSTRITDLLPLAVIATTLSLLIAGCGGGDDSDVDVTKQEIRTQSFPAGPFTSLEVLSAVSEHYALWAAPKFVQQDDSGAYDYAINAPRTEYVRLHAFLRPKATFEEPDYELPCSPECYVVDASVMGSISGTRFAVVAENHISISGGSSVAVINDSNSDGLFESSETAHTFSWANRSISCVGAYGERAWVVAHETSYSTISRYEVIELFDSNADGILDDQRVFKALGTASIGGKDLPTYPESVSWDAANSTVVLAGPDRTSGAIHSYPSEDYIALQDSNSDGVADSVIGETSNLEDGTLNACEFMVIPRAGDTDIWCIFLSFAASFDVEVRDSSSNLLGQATILNSDLRGHIGLSRALIQGETISVCVPSLSGVSAETVVGNVAALADAAWIEETEISLQSTTQVSVRGTRLDTAVEYRASQIGGPLERIGLTLPVLSASPQLVTLDLSGMIWQLNSEYALFIGVFDTSNDEVLDIFKVGVTD